MSQKKRIRHPFLYLLGPLALRWGLSIVIELIVIAILGTQKAGEHLMEITVLVSIATIAVFWKPYQSEREREARDCRKKSSLAMKDKVVIVICGICTCISLNNLIIQSGISRYSEAYQTTSQSIYGASIFVQLIGAAFLAPIAEELVYRGMLYRRMRNMLPMWMSILGSAIIFGINHGNLVQFIFAFIIGTLMAYLYEVYYTLKASVLFHIALNTTSLICTWLNLFSLFEKSIYLWTGVTFGLIVLAGVMIRYFVKIYSQNVHG